MLQDHIKPSYSKIKLLELLLILTEMNFDAGKKDYIYFSKAQRDCVLKIHDFVVEHITEHYTIEEFDAEDGSFAIYKSDDDNSGDFTYFAFAADTPDTTYHIEFRYGYTEHKINSFYDGDYAYWMASGIKTDASEDVISDCVELFCSENLAE